MGCRCGGCGLVVGVGDVCFWFGQRGGGGEQKIDFRVCFDQTPPSVVSTAKSFSNIPISPPLNECPPSPVEQLGDVHLHLLRLERRREALRVDADGERRDPGDAAVVLDAFGGALEAEDARARRDEVARVVVRVEAFCIVLIFLIFFEFRGCFLILNYCGDLN